MPKVVRFQKLGDASVLQLVDEPAREPGNGEVRIRVQAIGLNRAEVLFREGQYIEPPKLPSGLGYEAAGTVEAVGTGVSGCQVGDRITTMPAFSMRDYGVYGESVVVPAKAIAPWPDGLSAREAASLWVQYMTAWGALADIGGVRRGHVVLITAASSSVGYAAIQIVKAAGAVAIATTRTSAKKKQIAEQGADHVIATQEEDLPARVAELTGGHGADLIFDPVAGKYVETLAKAAAHGATIFLYGGLGTEATPFPFGEGLKKALVVRGYTLWPVVSDAGRLARCQEYVFSGLKAGTLKPVLDKDFPLAQVAEAHRYMESNQQNGKITVSV